MKYITMLIFALFVTGCSTISKWEPTLNSKVDKNSASIEQDVTECRVLANQAAGWVIDGAEGTLVGAAGAAATGALAGALIPGAVSAGTGAVIGAPIGAVAGLWYSEYEADLNFKRAYSNCLFQRGHFPIN
jgi:outer membrane lipoprotein SlyB